MKFPNFIVTRLSPTSISGFCMSNVEKVEHTFMLIYEIFFVYFVNKWAKKKGAKNERRRWVFLWAVKNPLMAFSCDSVGSHTMTFQTISKQSLKISSLKTSHHLSREIFLSFDYYLLFFRTKKSQHQLVDLRSLEAAKITEKKSNDIIMTTTTFDDFHSSRQSDKLFILTLE